MKVSLKLWRKQEKYSQSKFCIQASRLEELALEISHSDSDDEEDGDEENAENAEDHEDGIQIDNE